MAKSTRFATTVSTRNLINSNGFDGFYLDGRISGPRDSRMGETTLDREDRGFFYAIYTNTGSDIKQAAFKNKKHLDKIFEDMKLENKYNIDYEINELADCAVNIAARPQLNAENITYFGGLIVKDGEMAAITSGSACAYLYRNDILYPLTLDEFPIQDVDLNGNKIPNINLYCAGSAGTIRYSNIAQLQPDDCFILTNRVVMETIGHIGMLRLLEEAYDQQDAAAKVYDYMAEHNPNATMQFMIGFVESLNTLDKAALKSLTGRLDWTQKTLNSIGGLSTISEAQQLKKGLDAKVEMPDYNSDAMENKNVYQEYKPYQAPVSHNYTNEGQAVHDLASQSNSESGLNHSSEPKGNFVEARPVNMPNPQMLAQHEAQRAVYNQEGNLTKETPLVRNAQTYPQTKPANLTQDTQVIQARSNSIPVAGVAMPATAYQNNNYSNQPEAILRGVSEENGITTLQKVIIGILIFLILALLSFIGYLVAQTYFYSNETPNVEVSEVDKNTTTNENSQADKQLELPKDDEEEKRKQEEEKRKQEEEKRRQEEEQRKQEEEKRKKEEEEKRKQEEEQRKKYIVKPGDTLWSIAVRNKGSQDVNEYLDALIKNNPEALPNGQNSFIQEGMELKLP